MKSMQATIKNSCKDLVESGNSEVTLRDLNEFDFKFTNYFPFDYFFNFTLLSVILHSTHSLLFDFWWYTLFQQPYTSYNAISHNNHYFKTTTTHVLHFCNSTTLWLLALPVATIIQHFLYFTIYTLVNSLYLTLQHFLLIIIHAFQRENNTSAANAMQLGEKSYSFHEVNDVQNITAMSKLSESNAWKRKCDSNIENYLLLFSFKLANTSNSMEIGKNFCVVFQTAF